jgi:hypothetical protein
MNTNTIVSLTSKDIHALCTAQHGECPKQGEKPEEFKAWRREFKKLRRQARKDGTYAVRSGAQASKAKAPVQVNGKPFPRKLAQRLFELVGPNWSESNMLLTQGMQDHGYRFSPTGEIAAPQAVEKMTAEQRAEQRKAEKKAKLMAQLAELDAPTPAPAMTAETAALKLDEPIVPEQEAASKVVAKPGKKSRKAG